jgi:hypothetical protein
MLIAVLLAAPLSAFIAVSAQTPAQTASQFYLEYRKAFDASKRVEDLLPFMAAETRARIEATPSAERPRMFDIIKTMGALTHVKVVNEARMPQGATLTVDALDPTGEKTTGTIEIVREEGAWKLRKESW